MIALSLNVLMLTLFHYFSKCLIELSLPRLQVVLFDLELRFTSSTNRAFSLSLASDYFSFDNLLSHEVSSKHIFNDSETGSIASCEESPRMPHPGQLYLDLSHLGLCTRCKDLKDYSKSVNNSNLSNDSIVATEV